MTKVPDPVSTTTLRLVLTRDLPIVLNTRFSFMRLVDVHGPITVP